MLMSESPVNAESNPQPLRWLQYRLWSLLFFMCFFSCACVVNVRGEAWEVVKVIKPEVDGSVSSAGFLPDGSRLLIHVVGPRDPSTALVSNTSIFYDRKSWQPVQKFHGKSICGVALKTSPDGKRIILNYSVPSRTTLPYALWDVSNGELLATFEQENVHAFSPDGRLIVSTSTQSQQLLIRDAATGSLIRTAKLMDSKYPYIFSPDSRFLMVNTKPARLMDIETGQTRSLIKGHDIDVWSAAFSPRGEKILTVSHNRTLRVWETASGKQLFKIVDFPYSPSASFSPDGSMILTVEPMPNRSDLPPAPDRSPSRVRVWDAANGKEIGTYGETTEKYIRARFSPNGRYVLTKFSQKSHLYDLASGDLIFVFSLSASFSPDGKNVLTYSSEEVRIWRRRPNTPPTP